MISTLKLRKVKRPGGTLSYHFLSLAEDEFGTWLRGPTGSAWEAPHDSGTFPFDVVVLLSPERGWVAWWVDDPADRRLEIDVCLPPESAVDGWTYVDLELDPVRHETGTIEIQDQDEFDIACRNGWISQEDAAAAIATAASMEAALRQRAEPYGDEGWRRLEAARTTR